MHPSYCHLCGQQNGESEWLPEKHTLRTRGLAHACPRKPPLTPEEGAAALATVLGMAWAIKATHGEAVRACLGCGVWKNSSVGTGPNARCLECWDLRQSPGAGGPYR